jgi:hypothetical protein
MQNFPAPADRRQPDTTPCLTASEVSGRIRWHGNHRQIALAATERISIKESNGVGGLLDLRLGASLNGYKRSLAYLQQRHLFLG